MLYPESMKIQHKEIELTCWGKRFQETGPSNNAFGGENRPVEGTDLLPSSEAIGNTHQYMVESLC